MPEQLRPAPPTPTAEKLTIDPEAPKHIDNAGQEYFEVSYSPEDSMFLVRLLHGILPVSEIIAVEETHKWQYYSHRTPVRESEKTYSKAEIAADLAILGEIFGDKDRHEGGHNMQILEAAPGRWKVSYHDFEKFRNFSMSPRTEEDLNQIVAIKEENIRRLASFQNQGEFLRALEDRLTTLEARIQGPEGVSFMQAVVHAIPRIPPVLGTAERAPEEVLRAQIEKFQNALSARIRVLRIACERIRNNPGTLEKPQEV